MFKQQVGFVPQTSRKSEGGEAARFNELSRPKPKEEESKTAEIAL